MHKFRQLILDEQNTEKTCIVISEGTCDQVSGANEIKRLVKRYIIEKSFQGKITTSSIDQIVNGKEVKCDYKLPCPSLYIEPIELTIKESEELLTAKRPNAKQLSVKIRKNNFKEVESALTEKQAIKEAKRCLRCELETEDGKKFIEELKESVKEKQELLFR